MESIATVNGVELCFEAFGESGDPAILLVAGMASPMDWWEVPFCERLAAGGRFVVRYDLRDTGRSTTCPPGAPDYTFSDLIEDANGLLDALGIERARSIDVRAADNHAQLEEGPGVAGTIADIACLTLVIHGSDDPVFPIEHGRAGERDPWRDAAHARGRRP